MTDRDHHDDADDHLKCAWRSEGQKSWDKKNRKCKFWLPTVLPGVWRIEDEAYDSCLAVTSGK